MRKTGDLIADLEQEGSRHDYAAIVGVAENFRMAIASSDPNRLRMLNDLVSQGGLPLGMMMMDHTDGLMQLKVYVYPEYSGREREQAYLDLQMVADEVGMEILLGHGVAVDQDPKHLN
jgi:hypothetical protein